ncbi:ECF subfamily RNA polymerase sigma-24 subunit [Seminavis robusta]|uniref:ECF subfamily RNA polymerase sigma-24 subunit n=1 Tax=Seminavis robusta TaxID=568900 RepID=A0A9N8HIH1_9STRA|nr:ECF subfamily RNA polymerase sigma-24 subunit [Seminavis robusta]|eukprot:Sro500_g155320.1 ECF subfamily RNA polymerase sigma-24 subunit (935) ;mRNA; r:46847-49897
MSDAPNHERRSIMWKDEFEARPSRRNLYEGMSTRGLTQVREFEKIAEEEDDEDGDETGHRRGRRVGVLGKIAVTAGMRDFSRSSHTGGDDDMDLEAMPMNDMSMSEATDCMRLMSDESMAENNIRSSMRQSIWDATGGDMANETCCSAFTAFVYMVWSSIKRFIYKIFRCREEEDQVDAFDTTTDLLRDNTVDMDDLAGLGEMLMKEMAVEASQSCATAMASGTTSSAAAASTAATSATAASASATMTVASAGVTTQVGVAVGTVTAVAATAAVASSGILVDTTTSVHRSSFQPYPWIQPNCSGDGTGRSVFEVKQGYLDLVIKDLTEEMLYQEKSVLEDMFVEAFNNVTGRCDGMYERTMFNVSLLPSFYIMTDTKNNTIASTQWVALLSCNGCPDSEPMFAVFERDIAGNSNESAAIHHSFGSTAGANSSAWDQFSLLAENQTDLVPWLVHAEDIANLTNATTPPNGHSWNKTETSKHHNSTENDYYSPDTLSAVAKHQSNRFQHNRRLQEYLIMVNTTNATSFNNTQNQSTINDDDLITVNDYYVNAHRLFEMFVEELMTAISHKYPDLSKEVTVAYGATVQRGDTGSERVVDEIRLSREASFTTTTEEPSMLPSREPSSSPSNEPSVSPSNKPSLLPSLMPSTTPSFQPSRKPSPSPTSVPTPEPTQAPTKRATQTPTTQNPSKEPTTLNPSKAPTQSPVVSYQSAQAQVQIIQPTPSPTIIPTKHPTSSPPTLSPSTLNPTPTPRAITNEPTPVPTKGPTFEPTPPPTADPTFEPTPEPTPEPTAEPTPSPTFEPTNTTTSMPTPAPTFGPTSPPTEAPTEPPTVPPTDPPTEPPTDPPTNPPTDPPTEPPTEAPTIEACNAAFTSYDQIYFVAFQGDIQMLQDNQVTAAFQTAYKDLGPGVCDPIVVGVAVDQLFLDLAMYFKPGALL